jgi:hypothetical protein
LPEKPFLAPPRLILFDFLRANILNNTPLQTLCDIATDAHTRIQQDFKDINPVVGVSQKMREGGVPADAMTIDCLRSGKRIILVLHDQQAGIVNYQLSFKDQDPGEKFEQIPLNELTAQTLYEWIKNYFSNPEH